MRSHVLRLLPALLLLLTAPVARAQSNPPAPGVVVADTGMLVIYDGATVVGRETFVWENQGDSLHVTASASRPFLDEKGNRVRFEKQMELVVDARDLGLKRYLSNQSFAGHTMVRGLLPEDTVLTYYSETDEAGNAVRLVQPPGRLFVLDSGLFSLFDVLTRSVVSKQFVTRRVQMMALSSDTLLTPVATLTRAPDDTLRIGRRRVPQRRYVFEDASVRFDLWADPQGRLQRLTHAESGLRVERLPDETPADRPRRAARPKR